MYGLWHKNIQVIYSNFYNTALLLDYIHYIETTESENSCNCDYHPYQQLLKLKTD